MESYHRFLVGNKNSGNISFDFGGLWDSLDQQLKGGIQMIKINFYIITFLTNQKKNKLKILLSTRTLSTIAWRLSWGYPCGISIVPGFSLSP